VVFWWWVNQPGGLMNFSGGDPWSLSIESDAVGRGGHFEPRVNSPVWSRLDEVEHYVAAWLAGLVSDELASRYRQHTSDQQPQGVF
jgi:hypothetical protein